MSTNASEMNRLDLIHITKQFAEAGYSASKIAELLNISESTVRVYLNS